jgi:hypothetical protein
VRVLFEFQEPLWKLWRFGQTDFVAGTYSQQDDKKGDYSQLPVDKPSRIGDNRSGVEGSYRTLMLWFTA